MKISLASSTLMIEFKVTKINMILLVSCTIIFGMCQAQRTKLRRLNENEEKLLSKTESNANTSTGIKRDLKEQNTVNEDVSRLLEKLSAKLDKLERANQALNQALNQHLESASHALNQAVLEIHNDNENMRTELNKLQATCTCASTSLPSKTATMEPTTTPFLLSCDEGWKYFNGHCYLVVRKYKGWDSALAYCENRNSYLIEITTNAEFEFTATELVPPYSTVARFWVGATDRDIEGTFVYQHSQQQIPKKYWGYPQPSNNFGNDCLYITRVYEDLSFRDEWCTNYWFCICEKP